MYVEKECLWMNIRSFSQEMIKELVKSFPDMEVRGSIPEELEKSNNVDKGSSRRMGHHR